MSIRIDESKCRKCGKCIEACPGNLIKRNEQGCAYLKRPRDCWGCTSCLKECAFGAISFYLGADIGGQGSEMHTEMDGDLCHWVITRADGTVQTITINKKDANKY